MMSRGYNICPSRSVMIDNTADILQYFDRTIDEYSNENTRRLYRKFYNRFEEFLHGRRVTFAELTPVLVADFREFLQRPGGGLAPRAAANAYNDKLVTYFQTLSNKAFRAGAEDCGAFADVSSYRPARARRAARPTRKTVGIRHPFRMMKAVVAADLGKSTLLSRARDMFVLSVLCGGVGFDDLKSLRKSRIRGGYIFFCDEAGVPLTSAVTRILGKYDSAESEFCFPDMLDMDTDTYVRCVDAILCDLGFGTVVGRDISSEIWMACAGERKYDESVIARATRACSDSCDAATSRGSVVRALRDISDSIDDCGRYWFAIQVFRRHKCDSVAATLTSGGAGDTETYVPMETIAVRNGKKLGKKTVERIKGIMFVRTTPDEIARVASKIRGAGRVFRFPGAARAQYAKIGEREMHDFRMLFAGIDNGVEVEELDRGGWEKGRKVRITGGICKGYCGRILDLSGNGRVIRIRLTGADGAGFGNALNFNFRVDIPDYWIAAED